MLPLANALPVYRSEARSEAQFRTVENENKEEKNGVGIGNQI